MYNSFLNKNSADVNTRNTTKWVEKPLSFWVAEHSLILQSLIDCLKTFLMKKRWNEDIPYTLSLLFSPDSSIFSYV